MTGTREGPEPAEHPLAGVLGRLLDRERGSAASALSGEPRPSAAQETLAAPARRMLVIAALGPGEGWDALREAARWALRAGRRPVAVDLGAAASPAAGAAARGGATIPLASLPAGMDGLRREGPAGLAAVVERLSRHEAASDLLVLRIAAADRPALTRAAFLAGGIVLPIGPGDKSLYEAFCLTRDLKEALPGTAISPFSRTAADLERFARMLRDFLGLEAEPFDGDGTEAGAVLSRLTAPPEEGFLAALLAPGAPAQRSNRLLEMTSLPL